MAPAARRLRHPVGRGRHHQDRQRLEEAQHAGSLRRQRIRCHVACPTQTDQLHTDQWTLQILLSQL